MFVTSEYGKKICELPVDKLSLIPLCDIQFGEIGELKLT